jgi:IS1 family transposase/transposase-like protein
MDYATLYCPNRECTKYGKRGLGDHLTFRGYDQGVRRIKCKMCNKTFSARMGTAYASLESDERIITIAMCALAEGNSLRGTGRIVNVDKDTVSHWLSKAGAHCWAVTLSLVHSLHITECQLDELWSFVYKKEMNLSLLERVLGHYGDAWVWLAIAPEWRLVLAFVVGKRSQENADLLLAQVKAVSCGYIPFFTSDQLPHYAQAILKTYGVPEVLLDIPGKRGPKPKPKLVPPSRLVYAQVVKEREGGKVVKVTKKLIFGTEARLQERLTASTLSRTVNTSFVERQNLTCRQSNGRLSRKVLAFSKDLSSLENHLWLTFAYYHFVLPHSSLAQELMPPEPTRGEHGSKRTYRPVTPAMAACLTDHVWTMAELLSYRVPPHRQP